MSDIQFSVEMAELKKKVNFVRNGLGNQKTDLPGTLFRFNINGRKATLFAAGKEMFCRTEVKINRDEEGGDGTFSVTGSKLVNLINTAEAEQLVFKADAENLQVTAGFLTVNLVLFDGATLKQVENGLADHLTAEGEACDRSALEEALVCAKSCTTSNSIRPDVTHVELRAGRMLSSDGRKIMIYSYDGFDEKLKFKVPASILSGVISAMKNIEAENVQIIEGSSYYFIKANLNEYSFGVRKVEREFPAVEGQIQKAAAPEDEISIDKHVLEGALQGVSLGLDSEEVKVQIDADGKGTEAYLEVSAKNSLGRRSFERASCGRTGDKPVSFPVSFKHLLDTLSVFKGDSVVDVMVMQKLNLLMVKDVTEAREVTTIIPFRTDAQIEQEKKEVAEAEAARKKANENESTDTTDEGSSAVSDAVATDEDIDLDD